MAGIFLKLLNMSITAGWLIMAVIALRLLFRKAPKWLPCILWGMAAFRLVCPFSLESPFSLVPSAEAINPAMVQYGGNPAAVQGIGNPVPGQSAGNPVPDQPVGNPVSGQPAGNPVPDQPADNPASGRYAGEPGMESGFSDSGNMLNALINKYFAPTPGDSVNPLYVLMYLGGIVWVIGMIAVLGYGVVSFGRLCFRVREAVPVQDNVWICDAVKSPFILGVIRPRVYLPSGTGAEEGKYVLAHEQAHLKRKDHWWKLLGYLLLAVYWFHPLVWAAYILFCRDIELACDEKTIKYMDMKEKKAYSEALLVCSMQKKLILASPLAFGEIGIKERVKTVLHYKKPALWMIVAAMAACAVMAACFLTNPERDAFDIKIVIPAGSEGGFYYSEEEISPNGSRVTLSAGEGIGDTEVVLYPVDRKDADEYKPVYMTPGLPVKMNAQKGAWFRVGVNADNASNEDRVVYVRVEGITVRIADLAADGGAEDNIPGNEPASDE